MVMDMGRDAGQGVVELEYRPTGKDFTAALRQRSRIARSRRAQKLSVLLAAVVFAIEVAQALTGGGVHWFPMLWAPCFVLLLVASPWLQGRQFLKLAARNGTFRVTVSDAGVTVATEHSTTSIGWPAQPRYRETPEIFVTFSDDKNASCFTVLPKRGLQDPADADRLREILDRHLTRA
ncbi:YcxB family protein [Streptomyces tropicalis]|uniref:YcxB family protein n=1 Tax=Streptomyces tropicalis TaxID=3034234 RepID=A0ABT5ZYF3_9ACTN|nr:YcxB family protein [Streptomyces tropicalis]MDF3297417.1 YcxB family protein [Streptomyces tropicalis]